jgi:YVTN family beta-propeller protein
MSTVHKTRTKVGAVVAALLAATLTSCGGGGGGNGDFASGAPIVVSAFNALTNTTAAQETPFQVGTLTGTAATYAPFIVNPLNPQLGLNGVPLPVIPGATPFSWGSAQFRVAPSVILSPGVGGQSFLELYFGAPLRADTVFSTGGGTTDGITLQYVAGNAVPATQNGFVRLKLDAAGAIDPTNAVVNGLTPKTVRLYYDSDNLLPPTGSSEGLPNGSYVLRVRPTLRMVPNPSQPLGVPYDNRLTTASLASSSSNPDPVLPTWGFTVGTDTNALDWIGPNDGVTVKGVSGNGTSGIALDGEIAINFNDAIDFSALVGTASLTSRDPFCTLPFFMAQTGPDNAFGTVDDIGQAIVGNLTINYGLPLDPTTGNPLPLPFDLLGTPGAAPCAPNLAVIVYQPDPKFNPNQVRVRFCDANNLVGAENVATGQFQNYASNPDRLTIRSNNPALVNAATGLAPVLSLPPIQPVPGSIALTPATARATCTVQIGAAATDRSGNAAIARQATFVWTVGQPLARNPMGVDLVLVGMQSGAGLNGQPGVAALNTATITNTNGPGGLLTGTVGLRPNALQNSSLIGVPVDFEIGQPCNPVWAVGGFEAIRGTITPGIPDSQFQTIGASALGCVSAIGPCGTTAFAVHGNPMFVIDGTAGTLKVFNSYDWTLLSTVQGVGSPGGLGMGPLYTDLYVSNTDQDTIQRIDLNPASASYLAVTSTVSVGNGPRAISVTPSNEDVFVANYSDNSISILNKGSLSERVRLPVGLGPTEICITARMLGMGLTNDYQAFVFNEFSNSVDVYESGGGAELTNNPNGRIMVTQTGFLRPKRGSWNYQTYIAPGAGPGQPGVLVANNQGTTIDEYTMFNFQLGPPPGFPGTPPRRDMNILRSFSAAAVAPGASPTDVTPDALTAFPGGFLAQTPGFSKALVDPSANQGTGPRAVLASFPAAARVVVFGYQSSTAVIGSAVVPGCDLLHNFFSQ